MECIISVISWNNRQKEKKYEKDMSCQSKKKKKKTGSDWLVYLSGDAAVLVDIIQIKGPVEFISDGASQDDGQTYNKVLQQGKKTGTEWERIKSEDHNKDEKNFAVFAALILCFMFFQFQPCVTDTQQSEIILKK